MFKQVTADDSSSSKLSVAYLQSMTPMSYACLLDSDATHAASSSLFAIHETGNLNLLRFDAATCWKIDEGSTVIASSENLFSDKSLKQVHMIESCSRHREF